MVKILKNIKIFVFCLVVNNCFCQEFSKNISGTIGLLNPKIRLQYEIPLGIKQSYGVNFNYYFANWSGPLLEVFHRSYEIKKSNKEGWFRQIKLGYGNLESLPYMNSSSKRWSTFGGGIAWGYKYLKMNGFTIETLAGVRYYTPPHDDDKNGNQQLTKEELENFSWFLTTGFPLDLQIKFGYQF